MEIAVETANDVTIVTALAAELDTVNSAEFKRDLAPVLDAHAKVVLDLTRLRFIDSSGLGAILSCLRKLAEKRGELKLCVASKQVRASLELVRMYRILDVCGTRDEAMLAFRRPGVPTR